jgi:signal transduction histidine kinase
MFLASSVSAVIAMCITLGLIRVQLRAYIVTSGRIAAPRMVERGAVRDCLADPVHFSYEGPGSATTWGYDENGVAANPLAPKLDDEDVALGRALAADGVDAHMHGPWGAGIQLSRVGRGPCLILGSSFPPSPPVERLFKGAAFLALGVSLIGALLTWWLAVRPLVQRIGLLRAKASLVGSEAGYAPPEEGGADDLSVLGAELDRAHDRIRADADALEARQHDLRRHVENIAHDLKLPISSLQLGLERAASEAGVTSAMSELITAGIRDVVYLGGLTANLRLAAVLEGGWAPRLEPDTNLADVVERATSRVQLLARRRQIDLAVAIPDGGVLVAADPMAAEQAIANVVENAVSHGEVGGHVSVLLSRSGTEFKLAVMDDGPGVPSKALPLLGTRTFRTDLARKRDGRGQGLGLAITREICGHFRWSLEFERLEPSGLCVTLRGRVMGEANAR